MPIISPDDSQFSYVNRCAISDSMRTVLGTASAGPDHGYGLGGRNHDADCTIHFTRTLRAASFLPVSRCIDASRRATQIATPTPIMSRANEWAGGVSPQSSHNLVNKFQFFPSIELS